ncbi:PIN domain-containing protein [Ectopseudomonas toyotomiensis]|uniref:PIN domain-containing protein n=1 Tax=Ectopseudomonas toyotomiensis TaxID=554344 RepID=UPI003D0B48B5
MSEKKSGDNFTQAEKIARAFLNRKTLPNAAQAFLWKAKGITEAIATADVVIDTNALLVLYGTGSNSLDEVSRIFKALSESGRLYIPQQVAREFIKNRPQKIADLYQGMSDKVSKISVPEIISYPALNGIQEFLELNDSIRKIEELKRSIQKGNREILKRIKGWEWSDPISEMYRDVFDSKSFVEPEFDEEVILKELEERYELSIPPGYKDSNKPDYGIGDYLIWKTILYLGGKNSRDLIFVSGDEKADWQHSAGGAGFIPRFELLDEYRRSSDGQTFYMIPLSKLLELLNAEGQLVEEVKQEEKRVRQIEHVEVVCPHCSEINSVRLAENIGSSAVPVCSGCIKRFHVNRTATGVNVKKPFEKKKSEPESFIEIEFDDLEQIECPSCDSMQSCVISGPITRHLCTVCGEKSVVLRRADGTFKVFATM